MQECEHGGDPYSCPPCQNLRVEEPREPVPTTGALYDGRCPGCDAEIIVDDELYLHGDQWVCGNCHERRL